MKPKKKIAFVLGIRPDIIRAALILEHLKQSDQVDTIFIWSGQHYSDNLKGIFLRELGVDQPAIELGCQGDTDAEVVGQLIQKLYATLIEIEPDVVVYLGDTNTVASCIAPAQLNIPIVHIEGGMRSYDWRMPEEKYRTVSDHLADHIYLYFEEYKSQAINEGINPKNITVVGNPIVDILDHFYFKRQKHFDKKATEKYFEDKGLRKAEYLLMTCHRRENVHEEEAMSAIVDLVNQAPYPVYFPASYRTQRVIKEEGYQFKDHVQIIDPIGYEELVTLMANSAGVLTDSGTIVEEACILEVPSIQMRHSTERPQVYDAKSSIKFDPLNRENYPPKKVYAKLDKIRNTHWKHDLGDGKTSKRIAEDLISRVVNNKIRGHKPKDYHINIERSFSEDGIEIED